MKGLDTKAIINWYVLSCVSEHIKNNLCYGSFIVCLKMRKQFLANYADVPKNLFQVIVEKDFIANSVLHKADSIAEISIHLKKRNASLEFII